MKVNVNFEFTKKRKTKVNVNFENLSTTYSQVITTYQQLIHSLFTTRLFHDFIDVFAEKIKFDIMKKCAS